MKFYLDRLEMISNLEKGGVGAEIGVQNGYFSEALLGITSPSKLILVDCWEHQNDPKYKHDPANVPQAVQNEVWASVVKKFEPYPQVQVVRAYSMDAAITIPFGLDWVYLDANHSLGAVFEDLVSWSKVIKQNGCIMGHDFVDNGKSRKMGFGVVPAVEAFCRAFDWELVALTDEEWSSYKLVRK